MEFIIGIYDVERSGDTDRIRIRGSGRMAGSSPSAGLLVVDGEVRVTRLTSSEGWCLIVWLVCAGLQHNAFVRAPTKAQGAGDSQVTFL